MTVLERSDLPIDEQIRQIDNDIDSKMFNVEQDLRALFAHVKLDSGFTPDMLVRHVVANIKDVVRLQAINILLDVLTHPQRFEIFATLAGNVKEQSDEQG